jgi:hypothetical protein
MKLLIRLYHWFVQVLVAIDILCGLIIAMPFYVIMARGHCPNGEETMSSHVGRAAIAGEKWALDLEPIINWLMRNPNHCREAIETLKPLAY